MNRALTEAQPDPPLAAVSRKGNIPTYITLYIYAYRNVWELGPAVDPNHSPIEFESGPAASRKLRSSRKS